MMANYPRSRSAWLYTADDIAGMADGRYQPLFDGRSVLHGHFRPTSAVISQATNPFLLVWMRNPVDRLISLFHYWKGLPASGHSLQELLLVEDWHIVEFAEIPAIRDEMLEFFVDFSVHDYDFVGIQEHHSADVAEVAKRLGWRVGRSVRENTQPNKPAYDRATRAELARVLDDSMVLYKDALASRSLGHLLDD